MIKLIKSTFYHESETKQALVDFIMQAEALSMGPQCKKFEEDFAEKQGRKYAVYVANGSVANLALIQALLNMGRLKKGMKVGFSALTWPTNVMPLIQLGLHPIALDCEIDTLNVSPTTLAEYIDDIDALFLTNVLGFCDDIDNIRNMCATKNVLLLEDNCESLGSKVGSTLLGNFGLASTFSFFVGHHLSTIEGGMVCTDDKDLRDMLLMTRAHGWDRNLEPETQQSIRQKYAIDDFYSKYTFYDLASNFRSTEIGGFLGNTQLPYWDEIVSNRANNFKRLLAALKSNTDFYHYELSHMSIVSNFSMPVICKTPELARLYRERFETAQVEVRPVIAGDMSKQPFYKKYVTDEPRTSRSDLIHNNGFYFGNNPELTSEEVELLAGLLSNPVS